MLPISMIPLGAWIMLHINVTYMYKYDSFRGMHLVFNSICILVGEGAVINCHHGHKGPKYTLSPFQMS